MRESISADALLRQFCGIAGLACQFGEQIVTIGVVARREPPPEEKPVVGRAPANVREWAEGIVIPKVDLKDRTIREVLPLLRELARKHDPAKEGIGVVLRISAAGRARMDRTISLRLRRIQFDQLVYHVCSLTGLFYRFDNGVLTISDTSLRTRGLVTRTYRLAPGVAMPLHTRRKPRRIDQGD